MDFHKIMEDFFSSDDLQVLLEDVGRAIGCPVMVVDIAFRVEGSWQPAGFFDPVFCQAAQRRQITYEAMTVISQDPALTRGEAVVMKLEDTPWPRRFAPLVFSGIRIGYLICVDWQEKLNNVSQADFRWIEAILGKQLLSQTSRNSILSNTAEELLVRLLEGEFSSEAVFRMQSASSYLANYRPVRMALLDLSRYHNLSLGADSLKEELQNTFYASNPFFYQGRILFFLLREPQEGEVLDFAQRMGVGIVISEPMEKIFRLPQVYDRTLRAMQEVCQKAEGPFAVWAERVYPLLLLRQLQPQGALMDSAVRALAEHDRKNDTQYCLTLYTYLSCHHSLQRTCQRLYLHRNTALYRIRRLRDDFGIPLDDDSKTLYLLLSAAQMLLEMGQEQPFLPETTS